MEVLAPICCSELRRVGKFNELNPASVIEVNHEAVKVADPAVLFELRFPEHCFNIVAGHPQADWADASMWFNGVVVHGCFCA